MSSSKPHPSDLPDSSSRSLLESCLRDYQGGKISQRQFLKKFRDHFYRSHFQIIDGVARLDISRAAQSGVEEVIFAAGKSPLQLRKIIFRVLELSPQNPRLLITRLAEEVFERVRGDYLKYSGKDFPLVYHPQAQVAHTPPHLKKRRKEVAILTAGSSDIPVAEECYTVLSYWGIGAGKFYDVGVAGLGRLLGVIEEIRRYRIVIAVAGMEAALASVVGGLVSVPVIAVPTSVGYGASFQGLSSLLGMMNSCSPGVVVVNIDNGFGAAAAARKILAVKTVKAFKA